MYLLKPIFVEKIWGGNRLLSTDRKIGELWLASGIKGSSNEVEELGITLRDFYYNSTGRQLFPLLIKIIDANDDLSVQVHPNDEMAKKLEGLDNGKTECWYVLDANKDSELIVGTNSNSKLNEIALFDNSIIKSLRRHKVQRTDFFAIPAGTIHAIGSGVLVYEIQQPSDITYRLFDYDRLENGKPRELHIEKAKLCSDLSPYKNVAPLKKNVNGYELTSFWVNDFFELKSVRANKDFEYQITNEWTVITILNDDSALINGKKVKKYDTYLFDKKAVAKFNSVSNLEIMIGIPARRD